MPLRRDHLEQARRAALTGILSSLVLAASKISAGIAGHSYALIADGVESGGDSVAGLVVLFGLAQSIVPPDDEHPYGHSRAEDIAGKTVSTLMFVSGLIIFWTNMHGLIQEFAQSIQSAPPSTWTVWFAVFSLLVKGVLFVYKMRVARSLRSIALKADAWNDFTDCISAVAVMIGLAAVRFGFVWADRASAITVSLLIMYTAHVVSRSASAALLDQQAPPEVLAQLRTLAMSVPGVAGVEKLLARRSGLIYFVDMHLEVDGAMPVRDAHEIGHRVKARLQGARDDVGDVLIHLEPAPVPARTAVPVR